MQNCPQKYNIFHTVTAKRFYKGDSRLKESTVIAKRFYKGDSRLKESTVIAKRLPEQEITET